MAISFFGYSISTSIFMIIAFRLVQGACQAFTTTCCLALATDSLPPDKIGSGISIFSLSQAISQATAPGIGIVIGK
jgi:MFS family permease